jgi:transposase InsO family protein
VLVELSKVEQRYQAVLAVQVDGLTVTEVAEKFGVSRQTVHAWLRRYEDGGLEGLGDRSHRPLSCPHQMPAAIEVRVCELRRQHPYWGPVRIAHRLARDGVAVVPSPMGIWRALVRHGLVEPGQRRKRLVAYKRWERGRPMELWQFDVMGGVLLEDGRELKMVTGIDDHSRFCVAAGLVERATTRPVCGVFARAVEAYGVPTQVLTDNGKVFTGRFGNRPVEVLFDRICRENGIEHLLTAPRSPTTTGKIERFHGTMRRECLAGQVFATLADAQAVVNGWVHEYNTDRPHQSIGRCTPAERFAARDPGTGTGTGTGTSSGIGTGGGGGGLDAELPLDLSALTARRQGSDSDWVTRRVASNGIVCVAWQQVSVGKHRSGELVDVHVTDRLLEFWSGNDLLRTVVRESEGEVRKKRASKPARS